MIVNFHLPDFAKNYVFNMMFITLLKQYPERFREGVSIGSVYGEFPNSLWNGGRFSPYVNDFDAGGIKKIIRSFNSLGIPIRYTFSNPLIEREHLKDKHCNFCLDAANNGMNEVIVVSPVLERYIRKNFPSYKIISSTCKQLGDRGSLNAELRKDYKLVVLDYNWNNQFGFLEFLEPKDKVELLVNPVCIPECTRRGEHYKYCGELAMALAAGKKSGKLKGVGNPILLEDEAGGNAPKSAFECKYMNYNIYESLRHRTVIHANDIWTMYEPLGYTNYKIEGRTSTIFNLLETYLYYMISPNYMDKTRLEFLYELQKKNIISSVA